MNTLKKLFCSSLFLILLISCQKNIKDDYPEESQCDKFAGKYEMYDPISNETYNMVICCKGTSKSILGDSLEILNYGNKFNLNFSSGTPLDPFVLYGTIFSQAFDLDNNRWVLTTVGGSPAPQFNRLIGDSLYINFQVSNIAYYIADGVPYEAYTTGHYGIKVH